MAQDQQEQFSPPQPQEDVALAQEAGYTVNRYLLDPDSALSKFREAHPDISIKELTGIALEITEGEAQRRRTDTLLAHLNIFNRDGIEALATMEALKIKDKRRNAPRGVIVIFADANGLKIVNDEVGHPAGDDLLRGVGAGFRNSFRETDILGHPSGDEFVALLPLDNASQETPNAIQQFLEGDTGILTRFHHGIDQFRERVREQAQTLYGKPWPADTLEKRPGTVSTGWYYFPAEEYLQRYEDYIRLPERDKKTFTEYLQKEAEENMYGMKRGKTSAS